MLHITIQLAAASVVGQVRIKTTVLDTAQASALLAVEPCVHGVRAQDVLEVTSELGPDTSHPLQITAGVLQALIICMNVEGSLKKSAAAGLYTDCRLPKLAPSGLYFRAGVAQEDRGGLAELQGVFCF